MTDNPIIHWFRRDLRITDNPALSRAADTGKPIIAVFIDESDADKPLGAASLWWLHYSLTSLMNDLDVPLILRRGQAADILDELIKATGADHVVWNRRYEKDGIERDTLIKSALTDRGLKVESFKANLLNEPWEVKTKSDTYYKVFTPYWRAAREVFTPDAPLSAPNNMNAYADDLRTDKLEDWKLLPTRPDWGSKMLPYWTPGSEGAREALTEFLNGPVQTYTNDRNRPDKKGTSKLSPHLAFGEISPREIWQACESVEQTDKFMSEIGWREFSYNLLYHNPNLATENFRSDFDAFPWKKDNEALQRWQTGQTGYPFVDAGMRELWQTGWQHNRVRMVTASFLIKHIMLDWRRGEEWFWDCLVDADPASNAASWQWVAGSGADAAPYFRIFNPFSQGEKFDKNGDYVRRYVPELKDLPNKYLNRPWEAPKDVLEKAGVVLGQTYPEPIVDHKAARERALAAYKETRAEKK